MSFLPSFLRPAALAAATLVCALTPSASVTTATTAVIAATAATMVTASEAEAGRERVRDHRRRRCPPHAGGPGCG